MPKTLRINLLKTDIVEAVKELKCYGYVLSSKSSHDNSNSGEKEIFVDPDFSDLIVIPSEYFTDIKSTPFVMTGKLIFQV